MRKLLLGLVVAAVLGAGCGDETPTLSRSGTTLPPDDERTTTTESTTTTEAARPERPRGCSSERPSSAAWAGAAAPDPVTGAVAVDTFNAFLATARVPVTTSPCDAARVFVKADRLGDGGNLAVEVSPDDAASANVTVTVDGLEDDSVAAERWLLQFVEQPDGTIRLAAAQRTNRCQPGRGSQDFTPALCA